MKNFGYWGVSLLLFIAIFAPFLSPFDPNAIDLKNQYLWPSLNHLMGTDANGSDVFSQILYGARISLIVALSVVSMTTLIGLLVGSLAGLGGKSIDFLVMRVVDVVYAFPGFLLALALVAALGPSLKNLILAMTLTGWAGVCRLVRGEVQNIKDNEYVHAAQALGAGVWRKLVVHIWPNLIGILVVQASFAMAGAIMVESGLSFLGLGAGGEMPSWGKLLSDGKNDLLEAPYISFFPGLLIVFCVVSFNSLGEALRLKIVKGKVT